MKFLKSRYSENDHHFGETCMLRPHLGAKKGSRLKFPYLVCSCTFWSIYLLRQWDVVRCSSFPGEITYSCNSNPWNVRIPPKFSTFHTVTWWNTMSLWAQISSFLKNFIQNPLSTSIRTSFFLSSGMLDFALGGMVMEIWPYKLVSLQAHKYFLSALEKVTQRITRTKVCEPRSRHRKTFRVIWC